ncbi:MAG: T9SS type A sorting domain-containing protein [Chitinophagales bacterium]
MKKTSLTAAACLLLFCAQAQQAGKAVINCLGGTQTAGSFKLQLSVGEATAAAYDSKGNQLYQGFFSGSRSVVMTAVNDFHTTPMRVYPNPTAQWLNFDAGNSAITHVEVTNALGQKIADQGSGEAISVSTWENGIYLVRVTAENQSSFSTKLIKQ